MDFVALFISTIFVIMAIGIKFGMYYSDKYDECVYEESENHGSY